MKKIETAEMQNFRNILKIHWTEKLINEKILKQINKDQDRELLITIKRRNTAYLGHVFSSSKYHPILEEKVTYDG